MAVPLLIDPEKCNGCGLCVSVCPVQAISIIGDKAVIDHQRCNGCLLCMEECPNRAISHIQVKKDYVEQRKYPIVPFLSRTVPHVGEVSLNGKSMHPVGKRSGTFFDKIKKTIGPLFGDDFSSGMNRSRIVGKYRRQRRRRRGGRF